MEIRAATAAALIACASVVGACQRASDEPKPTPQPASESAPSQPAPAPAPVGPPPSELRPKIPLEQVGATLPPLPLGAAPRPREYVAAAYEFAALHPEVLKYVPCYCGCERTGHQHNESCFIARRDADGRVLEWDSHGMG